MLSEPGKDTYPDASILCILGLNAHTKTCQSLRGLLIQERKSITGTSVRWPSSKRTTRGSVLSPGPLGRSSVTASSKPLSEAMLGSWGVFDRTAVGEICERCH